MKKEIIETSKLQMFIFWCKARSIQVPWSCLIAKDEEIDNLLNYLLVGLQKAAFVETRNEKSGLSSGACGMVSRESKVSRNCFSSKD